MPAEKVNIPTIGVLGKTRLTSEEEELLYTLGRVIARAGKTLLIVPAAGTAKAVQMGVSAEGGMTIELRKDVLGQSAHAFVYADERLLNRLTELDKDIAIRRNVTLLSSPLEIELWLDAAKTVFQEKGLTFPLR